LSLFHGEGGFEPDPAWYVSPGSFGIDLLGEFQGPDVVLHLLVLEAVLEESAELGLVIDPFGIGLENFEDGSGTATRVRLVAHTN